MSKEIYSLGRALAEKFIAFNKEAVSPYNAVSKLQELFESKKFNLLREDEVWSLEAGKTYYLVRGGYSSIMAFHVPKSFEPKTSAFKIFGTHIDSPCLRLAPKFATSGANFEQALVQCYGGGIWHTWFDRDLVLGGRVVVRESHDEKNEKGETVHRPDRLRTKIYSSNRPIAKVSTLAIHLQKDRSKFEINKETDLRPILSSLLLESLNQGADQKGTEKGPTPLQKALSAGLGCDWENIVNFDLCFADSQPSGLVGLNEEFISAPRIDNLYSVFCSTEAFVQFAEENGSSGDISVISIFDHEEIGSQTYVGADSNFGPSVYHRILEGLGHQQPASLFDAVMARSLLVSADMAHSVHPNYQGNHQFNHRPEMNKGVVLKINCNGRYTTDAISGAIIKNVAKKNQVPLQEFVVHNESPCGSTIGPLLASRLGCLAVDIGAPQLGMHSIRETAGVLDFEYYRRLFLGFMRTNMREELPQ